jgi:hypothetical protein
MDEKLQSILSGSKKYEMNNISRKEYINFLKDRIKTDHETHYIMPTPTTYKKLSR